jgi:hypothetical protein
MFVDPDLACLFARVHESERRREREKETVCVKQAVNCCVLNIMLQSIVVVFLYVVTPPSPHPLSFYLDDPLDASFIVNWACVVYS